MVHFTIKPGITGNQLLTVGNQHTASSYGSGNVDVFATPAMIALMEMTARNSIEYLLPEGYTTVGTELSVKHLHPTPVGHQVRCESKVITVSGNKVVFEVLVWDKDILIGHGMHHRAIVHLEKFMQNI